MMNRRVFLESAGVGLAALQFSATTGCSTAVLPGIGAAGVGICDWNLGPMCDPGRISLAREADLEGIQVSLGSDPENMPLRDPLVRQEYLRQGEEYGITFHSVAIGMLNTFPLATEPRSAIWVVDALETAAAIGAANILLAFFGNGDLRWRDEHGTYVDEKDGAFSSFRLDEEKVTSVVETLQHVVPRARDAGVIIGLENTITAKQSLEIIDRVGSEWVQIYYDVGNSTGNGYDVPGELRLIGNDRLCEFHLKDWNTSLLGSEGCMVDMAEAASVLEEISFDKWLVLETSGRRDQFLEDTRRNAAFARETFRMA
ncbi:sugar phosphate isomerase/epimerase family protein [Candidatus Zixiibacteriota bacterium]